MTTLYGLARWQEFIRRIYDQIYALEFLTGLDEDFCEFLVVDRLGVEIRFLKRCLQESAKSLWTGYPKVLTIYCHTAWRKTRLCCANWADKQPKSSERLWRALSL